MPGWGGGLKLAILAQASTPSSERCFGGGGCASSRAAWAMFPTRAAALDMALVSTELWRAFVQEAGNGWLQPFRARWWLLHSAKPYYPTMFRFQPQAAQVGLEAGEEGDVRERWWPMGRLDRGGPMEVNDHDCLARQGNGKGQHFIR